MTKRDRWGSYPIIGSAAANGSGQFEALLKVSLRDTGEEAGVIRKCAEDRYIAFVYERTADGRRGGLHPVKECSTFNDAAYALRLDYRSRTNGRNRLVQS